MENGYANIAEFSSVASLPRRLAQRIRSHWNDVRRKFKPKKKNKTRRREKFLV